MSQKQCTFISHNEYAHDDIWTWNATFLIIEEISSNIQAMVEFAMVIYLNQECLQNASLDTCAADPYSVIARTTLMKIMRNDVFFIWIQFSPNHLCNSDGFPDADHEEGFTPSSSVWQPIALIKSSSVVSSLRNKLAILVVSLWWIYYDDPRDVDEAVHFCSSSFL